MTIIKASFDGEGKEQRKSQTPPTFLSMRGLSTAFPGAKDSRPAPPVFPANLLMPLISGPPQ